jgi:hypothetical protein
MEYWNNGKRETELSGIRFQGEEWQKKITRMEKWKDGGFVCVRLLRACPFTGHSRFSMADGFRSWRTTHYLLTETDFTIF